MSEELDTDKEYQKAKKEALVRHLIEMEAIFDPVVSVVRLHSRALSCHCECLGMNAENALAVCGNYSPPYNDAAYYSVMQKWGLSDEKGEPLI